MSKDDLAGRVGTYAAKVGIMERRLSVFVKRGVLASNSAGVKVCSCR